MINVREYFENLMNEMNIDDVFNLEEKLFDMYENDYEDFVSYMKEHDVDLDSVDKKMNEKVLTLWVWDMCGD